MEYMFAKGFLGTRAPFFMDFITLIVTLLPLFVAIGIRFARRYDYEIHALIQMSIFVVSLVIFGYFEYGVRLGGGFEAYFRDSGVEHNYAVVVLAIHIFIAVITLGFWISTIINARRDRGYNLLPGVHTASHRRAGIRTFIGIVFTSFSGLWVYLLLFVY